MIINPYVFGPSHDADALAWAAAVTGAGGTYSAATLTAVSNFCVAAKANGYWSKLTRINLFAGDQLAAALVPLKVGGGSATDTNVNFVSGDYTEATGLAGNGSSKYLSTGLLASALTMADCHGFVYNRSSSAGSGGVHMAGTDGTNHFRFHLPWTDGNLYNDIGLLSRVTVASLGSPYGFVGGTRTSTTLQTAYRNGSAIGADTTSVSAGLGNHAIYVFASNNSDTATSYVGHTLGGYSIGAGLSGTDATNFNTDMQAFQTALGRNV